MKATPRARGGAAKDPAPAPLVAHDGPDAGDVRAYRLRALAARAKAVAKRAGKATARDVRLAQRRARHEADKLAATPEGRERLRRENDVLAGAGPAIAMLARADDEYLGVLEAAADLYGTACDEFGLESESARRWALQAGLFSAIAMHLLGETTAAGARTMTMSKSAKGSDGTAARVALGGTKDYVSLAAVCSAKALYCSEMAWRSEDRARLEARLRERAREEDKWRARSEALARERAALPSPTDTHASAREEDHHAVEISSGAQDVTEEPGDSPPPGATVRSADRAMPGSSRDDYSESEPQPALVDWGAYCSIRRRTVPTAMAGRPAPSAGDGPGWVERQEAEASEIAAWERDIRSARVAGAANMNARQR